MKTSCSNIILLSALVHSATAFAPTQKAQQSSAIQMKSPFGNFQNPFENQAAKKAAEEAAAKAAAEAAAEEARRAKLASAPKLPSMDELMSKLPDVDLPELGDFDVGAVVDNLTPADGKALGERGEAYFAAQVVLVLCILIGTVPVIGEGLNFVFGPVTVLGGLGLAALSVIDLGSDSLSPFPAATESSTLKTTGIYAEMRHPLYTSLMLIMLGLSISTDSASRLLLTIVLGLLLEVKSEKEEEFLVEKFPEEYPAYREKVSNKFFPTTITNELGL